MSRPIKYAKLQTNLFIPDVGDLTATLPPIGKSIPGFSMTMEEDGLHLFGRCTSGPSLGKPFEAFVAKANIVIALFASEEKLKSVKFG